MAKGIKHTLTEKEVKWLSANFRNTKNAELAAHLGISESALHRYAREYGLTKTARFMHKCQAATTAAAKASHLRNGTYPPKGYRIPRSEEFCFKKGEKPIDRLGKRGEKKRITKAAATRRATFREEKARVMFGLKQRTKLRVVAQPRHIALQRHYLRGLGYIVARGSLTAYYTPDTKRSATFEARTPDTRNFVRFEFLPLPATA